MIDATLLITSLTLFCTTLLPICPGDHWLVRAWEFPRLQIFVLSLFNCLLVMLLTPDFQVSLAAMSLFCAMWQAYWIRPYTRLSAKEVADGHSDGTPSLKIITANVLMDNRDAGPLLEQVNKHRPDLLVTLETDTWW